MNLPNGDTVKLTESDPKLAASFKDGWLCGFTWPKKWDHEPGGPWVYQGYAGEREPKFIQMAIDSKNSHTCWMAGWRLGKSQQNRTWSVDEHLAAAKAF
jgi:hypothetical protein